MRLYCFYLRFRGIASDSPPALFVSCTNSGTGAGEFYLCENTFKNSGFKAVFVRFGATLGVTGASIATHSRRANRRILGAFAVVF